MGQLIPSNSSSFCDSFDVLFGEINLSSFFSILSKFNIFSTFELFLFLCFLFILDGLLF